MAQSNGLKVVCEEDCGNSPKKQLLKELTIAFAKYDVDFCLEWVTEDVVWDMVGDQLVQGHDDYKAAILRRFNRPVVHLDIHNIITHGNTGSVNGTFVLDGDQRIAFCDVFNFRGFGKKAKIKMITSYVIKIS